MSAITLRSDTSEVMSVISALNSLAERVPMSGSDWRTVFDHFVGDEEWFSVESHDAAPGQIVVRFKPNPNLDWLIAEVRQASGQPGGLRDLIAYCGSARQRADHALSRADVDAIVHRMARLLDDIAGGRKASFPNVGVEDAAFIYPALAAFFRGDLELYLSRRSGGLTPPGTCETPDPQGPAPSQEEPEGLSLTQGTAGPVAGTVEGDRPPVAARAPAQERGPDPFPAATLRQPSSAARPLRDLAP